jgi:hypothetical protein
MMKVGSVQNFKFIGAILLMAASYPPCTVVPEKSLAHSSHEKSYTSVRMNEESREHIQKNLRWRFPLKSPLFKGGKKSFFVHLM